LLRITPTGAVSEQTIFEYHYDGNSNPQSQPTAQGLSLLPDGLGGVIATWRGWTSPGGGNYHHTATRFDANGVRSDHVLSTSQNNPPDVVLTGDDGTAYISSWGGPLTAVDVRTWATKWTVGNLGEPVMALADGGVVLHNSYSGTMSAVDSGGTTIDTSNIQATSVVTANTTLSSS